MEGINVIENKDRVAIVVVGYNRLTSLRRLLESISAAEYESNDIPLVISIDASGNQEVYAYVNNFIWEHGAKYVNIQQSRLGLKKHLFQCFSLTKYFKGVIILEDDIFVSPYFYNYAVLTLEKYGNEDKVAGIALYSNEVNGYKGIPFQPVTCGWDVFAWQTVCSWGEMMNERMWNNFSEWLNNWDEDFTKIDMDNTIKSWTRAWSKYVYAYMVQTQRYFIYPYMPVTTNFNDAGGEHGGGDTSLVQVSLLQGRREYQLGAFSQLVHYDVYNHNEEIPSWLGLAPSELTIDYYGQRDSYSGQYVLSPFKLPYKVIRGFGHNMRPWELNIKYGIEGKDILLYDRGTSKEDKAPKRQFSYDYLMYYFQRYRLNLSMKLILKDYWKRIEKKMKKLF